MYHNIRESSDFFVDPTLFVANFKSMSGSPGISVQIFCLLFQVSQLHLLLLVSVVKKDKLLPQHFCSKLTSQVRLINERN